MSTLTAQQTYLSWIWAIQAVADTDHLGYVARRTVRLDRAQLAAANALAAGAPYVECRARAYGAALRPAGDCETGS